MNHTGGELQLMSQGECVLLRCARAGLIQQAGRKCLKAMAQQEEATRRASLLDVPRPRLVTPTTSDTLTRSRTAPAFERLHALGPRPEEPAKVRLERELAPMAIPTPSRATLARSTAFARSAAMVQRGNGRSRDLFELLQQREARIEQQLQYRQLCGLR